MEKINSIELTINDLPPRKLGNKGLSQFANESGQIVHVNNLRREFSNYMKNKFIPIGDDKFGIEARIDIYFKTNKLKLYGDLDNYISGILDCLQKCDHSNSEVMYKNIGLISDDIYIDRVLAFKYFNSIKNYYTIRLNVFERQ